MQTLTCGWNSEPHWGQTTKSESLATGTGPYLSRSKPPPLEVTGSVPSISSIRAGGRATRGYTSRPLKRSGAMADLKISNPQPFVTTAALDRGEGLETHNLA